MIAKVIAFYRPRFVRTVLYMLQSVEYEPSAYVRWFWRVQDMNSVMRRRHLVRTRPVLLLGISMVAGIAVQIGAAVYLYAIGAQRTEPLLVFAASLLLFSFPWVWAHVIVVPLLAGQIFVIRPRQRQGVQVAQAIFKNHPGVKIAVAGSYGKTTMKELLASVLGGHFTVAVTPANKNVLLSQARFAKTLRGDEDFVVVEFGEGAPGDVGAMTAMVQPTHAIVTGLAPAHLDRYKTLDAAARDIFSVSKMVEPANMYVNDEVLAVKPYLKPLYGRYNRREVLGWVVERPKVTLAGTSFTLRRGSVRLKLHTKLLGMHNIGPIGLVAVIAYEHGMQPRDIEQAVAATQAHEHRMSQYGLAGATIIDDTYNGNIEGIRAGTELLAELPAAGRKWYVTPGLVDQGAQTQTIHEELGKLIAAAEPDVVVLMQNSVSDFIGDGLRSAGYAGELQIQEDPLTFYTHLDQFVAAGDLVMMQNDWTDNYA